MSKTTHTEAPPFELNATDRSILAQTDDEFHSHDWAELRQIIANNNLSVLKRKPSDLRRYINWTREIKATYGSITNFLCQERLHWEPLPSSSAAIGPIFSFKSAIPFENQDDYQILRNDWPYGLTADITHLVVWLKTRIPIDEGTGQLLPESWQMIKDFVQRTFIDRLEKDGSSYDRVQWFKNWTELQSVQGLEHVHVLVRDVPDVVIDEWTGVK